MHCHHGTAPFACTAGSRPSETGCGPDNRINSQPVAFKTCKALLYYFTTVRGDLDLGERYEVDHIIPKGRTVGSNPDADSLTP